MSLYLAGFGEMGIDVAVNVNIVWRGAVGNIARARSRCGQRGETACRARTQTHCEHSRTAHIYTHYVNEALYYMYITLIVILAKQSAS